jgi:hypothetical protein
MYSLLWSVRAILLIGKFFWGPEKDLKEGDGSSAFLDFLMSFEVLF